MSRAGPSTGWHGPAAPSESRASAPAFPDYDHPRRAFLEEEARVYRDLFAPWREREERERRLRMRKIAALERHVAEHEDATDRREASAGNALAGMLEPLVKAAALQVEGPPDFEAVAHDGRKITLAGLRGKVVLLSFWSPG